MFCAIPYQGVKLSYLKVVHLVEVEGVHCHGAVVKRVPEWGQHRVLVGWEQVLLVWLEQGEDPPWEGGLLLQWEEVQEELHHPLLATCLLSLHHRNHKNVSNIIVS